VTCCSRSHCYVVGTQSGHKFSMVTPQCPTQHMTHVICWKFSPVPTLQITKHMMHDTMTCNQFSQVSPLHTTQHTTHMICRKFSPAYPLHTTQHTTHMICRKFSPAYPLHTTQHNMWHVGKQRRSEITGNNFFPCTSKQKYLKQQQQQQQ